FNLVAHAEAMAAADAVGLEQQLNRIGKLTPVESDREALVEADRYLFASDIDIVTPEDRSHDGLDDPDAARKVLEVLGFVGSAEQIRVCRVRFLGGHLVAEARFL